MEKIIDFFEKRLGRMTEAELFKEVVISTDVTAEHIGKLLQIIAYQEQRIDALYGLLYKIAPDIEIIETLAETEEEEQELINRYMNHGDYTECR